MVWAHGLRGAGRGAAPRGATRIFREGNRTRTKIDGHLERKHGCFAGRVAAPRRGARRGYSESSATPQVNALGAFAANELSALYLDVAKDRLYVSSRDAGRRVACQSVLVACLDVLPKLMAPVLPHLAEELYQSLPHVPGTGMTAERGSVFGGAPWKRGALADFPAHDEAAWAARRALRDDANAAIEKLRRDKVVGASLDAAVGSPERSSMSLDPTRMPRPSRACRRLQKSSETDFEVRSRPQVYAAPPTDPEAKAAFDLALSGLSQAETFAPHGSECDAVDDARFLFLVSDVDTSARKPAFERAAWSPKVSRRNVGNFRRAGQNRRGRGRRRGRVRSGPRRRLRRFRDGRDRRRRRRRRAALRALLVPAVSAAVSSRTKIEGHRRSRGLGPRSSRGGSRHRRGARRG